MEEYAVRTDLIMHIQKRQFIRGIHTQPQGAGLRVIALERPHKMNQKFGAISQKLLAACSVAVIIASATWIYFTQFATKVYNQQLHEAVGQAMAEETHRLLPHNATILIVTMKSKMAPEIKIQVDAFEKQLKLISPIIIKDEIVLDPRENPKFRPGAGLSTKRLLKIARKNHGVDAIVSFVGSPALTDEEIASLKSFPKFFAETRSPERLQNMFEKKVLQVAIVPRFEFPAPGPRKPETSRQWFDHYFQVVRPETRLPGPDGSP